jgi:hypothetical protein
MELLLLLLIFVLPLGQEAALGAGANRLWPFGGRTTGRSVRGGSAFVAEDSTWFTHHRTREDPHGRRRRLVVVEIA